MKLRHSLILMTAVCLLSGMALAKKEELPAVSPEGLELRKGKVASVLYVRPGVDFSRYKRIAILECPVAFHKDWERERAGSAQRISQKDMDEIKAGRSYTLSESAGGMTLCLEFYDSVTSEILARAIDRENDRGTGRIQWQSKVTNTQEANAAPLGQRASGASR